MKFRNKNHKNAIISDKVHLICLEKGRTHQNRIRAKEIRSLCCQKDRNQIHCCQISRYETRE